MQIRNATYKDAPTIKELLDDLGYKTTISLLINQLENCFAGKDHQVIVYPGDQALGSQDTGESKPEVGAINRFVGKMENFRGQE